MKTTRKSSLKKSGSKPKKAIKGPKSIARKRGPKSKVDVNMLSNSPFKIVGGYNLDDMPAKGAHKDKLPYLVKTMEAMTPNRHKGIPLKSAEYTEKHAKSLYQAATRRFKGSKHSFTVRMLKDAKKNFVEMVIFRLS